MPEQNIRLRLEAYDHRVLDKTTSEIIETVKRTGARFIGPVPLPTKLERFTVLRSPHIDKKSREQFEIRSHKRLLDIVNPGHDTIESLRTLDLPAGVSISIKVQGFQ
ncbi:MAG: 30S ribosomal protein S10 [Alphaproteobacteria bacterium]|nr:30S ribosomal protein S10 [Alphaproteobacteria bacterium]